jgi:hypothetical protein
MRQGVLRTSLLAGLAVKALALAALLGLAVLALTGGRLARGWERARQQERLQAYLDVVQASASAAGFAEDPLLAQQVVGGLLGSRDIQSARLLCGDRVLAEAARNGLTGGAPVQRVLPSPFGDGASVGSLVLLPDLAEANRQGIRTAALFRGAYLATLLLLTLVLLGLVHQAILRPIGHLRLQIQAMDATSARRLRAAPGHAWDEVGQLAADVESLMARLLAARWRSANPARGGPVRRDELALAVVRRDAALEAWTPGLVRVLDLAAPPAPGTPLDTLLGDGSGLLRACLEREPVEGRALVVESGGGDPFRLWVERIAAGWFRVTVVRERPEATA